MDKLADFFNIDPKLLFDILNYFGKFIAFQVVFFILVFIAIRVSIKLNKKSETDFYSRIQKNLKLPVILLSTTLSLWLPISLSSFPESISSTAGKALSILFIILFSWIVIRFIQLVKFMVLRQYDINQKDNLKARKIYTQFKIIERVLITLTVIIAISLILMSFSGIRQIGISLIASAGVTGIIIGLAAQKIIGGFLAGIQIAITQPIRLDDVVIVENEWGRIEEINLTYVVVKIWDERRLVLPSTYFIEKPFQNWTRSNSQILGTVFIYTDYEVDFDEIRNETTRLLKETPLWDGRVNVLQVTGTTEKTVETRLLVSATDSPTAWDLRVYLRENIIKFIQKRFPESLPKSRVVIKNN
ncbi:MAG: mechanosensitive ion channel [Prolixibacteraceae bacterium]|jgi:small-conductance mechanosensitive channel|nr:mechanosensitive ion channel [Prolixibacteraceae bacterium]